MLVGALNYRLSLHKPLSDSSCSIVLLTSLTIIIAREVLATSRLIVPVFASFRPFEALTCLAPAMLGVRNIACSHIQFGKCLQR